MLLPVHRDDVEDGPEIAISFEREHKQPVDRIHGHITAPSIDGSNGDKQQHKPNTFSLCFSTSPNFICRHGCVQLMMLMVGGRDILRVLCIIPNWVACL